MLTNWGDLLTNVPASGTSIAPADYANTITVANQAARLALTNGTGTGQVQPGDVVLQSDTTPPTVWVLAGTDPATAGNWRQTSGRVLDDGNYTAVNGGSSGIYFAAPGPGYLGYWTATGLSVGNFAAEAPFHGRSSTGPQEIWEYADNVDARITVDASGNTVMLATGNISLNGDNRATYDASPSATTIRDILISFGLMAAS